jgi:hypothetical protein
MNMHGHGLIKTWDTLLVASLCATSMMAAWLASLHCVDSQRIVFLPFVFLPLSCEFATTSGAHAHLPATHASWAA